MAQSSVLGPEEMLKKWQQALPEEVVETFNELLAQKFDGQSATIKEKDLLSALSKKGLVVKDINDQRWLYQTQQLYKERGWKVTFKCPGWDDNFDAYFRFDLK